MSIRMENLSLIPLLLLAIIGLILAVLTILMPYYVYRIAQSVDRMDKNIQKLREQIDMQLTLQRHRQQKPPQQ